MAERHRYLAELITAVGLLSPAMVMAQPGSDSTRTAEATIRAPARFYSSLEPLEFRLSLNMRVVRADTMDDPPSRAATVSLSDDAGKTVDLPVKVKTHGRWRLTNCEFPPLTVNFGDARTTDTPLAGLGKARMTSVCRSLAEYEQYVLQELQLYRVYGLLTPYSQAARAVKVTWVDSANGRTIATRYGFFIEDRDAFATRLNSAWMKAQGAIASDLSPPHAAVMGLFEYLISNTDFFLSALHNVLLLGTPAGEIVPVAFDFDYAGAVNTPYAIPNPILKIKSVRDRLFRGPCANSQAFQEAYALFNERRPAIQALYDDPIGKLLRWEVANDTRKFFDDFYRVINDTALARVEIMERCEK